MPTYEEQIRAIPELSFDDIFQICVERLPTQYRNVPWLYPGLDRGKALLESDGQACAYIVAYGQAHKNKVEKAFDNFPFQVLQQGYEIVDWACGQGLASVCFLDLIRRQGRINAPRKVTLIEPSAFTLGRAKANVSQAYTGYKTKIETKCAYLPADGEIEGEVIERIDVSSPVCIHFFSNILDIETVNLKGLASVLGDAPGIHFIMCMGPTVNASRMDAFARYFDLENGFTRWMSKRSFGLYVFHYLGISSMALIFAKHMLLPAPLCYIISLLAGFVFGYGLYEIISRIPFYRWAVLGIKKEKKHVQR